jgi:anti-sigma B factor antagonist
MPSTFARHQPGKLSTLFASAVRVFFTTLLFTAAGMGVGLLLGIIGMITYGLIAHVQPDMRNAYRHIAIPLAITVGCIAFLGAIVLELRARRRSGALPAERSSVANRIPDKLDLTTEITPTETIVHGCGVIWLRTAPLLRATVNPLLLKDKTVVIDMANVSHLDSTGLGTLRQLYDSATAADCRLKLVNLNQRLKTLFSITTLDKLMAPAFDPDHRDTR